MQSFNNFAITGTGRCGTKFLATVMNRSKLWTVRHEVLRGEAIKRLQRDHYGEVSSKLPKLKFLELPVAKRGIILRRPSEVLVSFENRNDPGVANTTRKLKQSGQQWYHLDKLLEQQVPIIWFHRMTSSVAYLTHVLAYFGITDVTITPKIVKQRINHTPKKHMRARTISKCSPAVQRVYADHAKWFEEKYFGTVPENLCCV